MSAFADNLARAAEAATTGQADPELVRWLAEGAIAGASVVERARARNLLLREAAASLPGSRWARAKRLEKEIATVSWAGRTTSGDRVRESVAKALRVGPRSRLSLRHLLRVLG